MAKQHADYQVRNACRVLHTFSSFELAKSYVDAKARLLPDLVVEEVVIRETRRPVYRPTPHSQGATA